MMFKVDRTENKMKRGNYEFREWRFWSGVRKAAATGEWISRHTIAKITTATIWSAPAEQINSGLVGLILSIVSVFGCGALLAIPGVICCIVCLVKNKKDVKSIVGVVIGAVSMIVWLVIWGLVFNMVVKNHVLEDSRTYYENQIDTKETEENIEKNNDKPRLFTAVPWII